MRALLLFAVLFLAGPALAAPRVAVALVENQTGDASLDGAGPGVTAILQSKFTKIEAVDVVERERIDAIMAEIELSQSGLVDPKSALEAGKLLEADYMVFGRISSVKLPNLIVQIWVVDTQSGEHVVNEVVTGEVGERGEEFFVLIDELAFLILDGMQVRLAARDRLAFGEVDVRELSTVDVYGRALEALSAGDTADAKQLLSKAVTLEPEFKLAEEALTRLASEVSARESVWAHEAITVSRERWKALEEEVTPSLQASEITAEVLAHRALVARFALMRGEFDRYFELEEQRIADTTAWLDAQREVRAPMEWPQGLHPWNDFGSTVRDLIKKHQLDAQRDWIWRELHFWPWEVRNQLAQNLLRLGETEQGVALLIDNYQHPGPMQSARSGPMHPFDVTERWDLHATHVVFAQQRVRQAELDGDRDQLVRANKDLKDALGELAAHDKRVAAYQDVMRRLTSAPRDTDALNRLAREELGVLHTGALEASGHALKGYRAFLARVEAGVYEPLRTSGESRHRDTFEDLADRWRDVARAVFSEHYFADMRIQHLLTYQELVPPQGAEEEERYKKELESEIRGMYRL